MINLTVAKKLEQLHLLSDKKLQKLQTRYYYNTIKHSRYFAKQYYPNTEIISVNPVGLKGIFTDLYTEKYLQATGDKQAENF